MHKLSVEAPPKILVERYLIEIAKNYNVPYEPDAMVHVSIKEVNEGCASCLFTSDGIHSSVRLRCVPGRRPT